jgi:hypothetical protein
MAARRYVGNGTPQITGLGIIPSVFRATAPRQQEAILACQCIEFQTYWKAVGRDACRQHQARHGAAGTWRDVTGHSDSERHLLTANFDKQILAYFRRRDQMVGNASAWIPLASQ